MDAASPGPGAPAAETFPPTDLPAFLRLCAGEWMSLRSRFALGEAEAGENGDEWHSSERGELQVRYEEPGAEGEPGGLSITPQGQPPRQLLFDRGGGFRAVAPAGSTGAAGPMEGHWQLWPDGSLELCLAGGDIEVRERIWFTKPNLRLRSTVEHHGDGTPGRASFSSEIRRVSRPATPAAA